MGLGQDEQKAWTRLPQRLGKEEAGCCAHGERKRGWLAWLAVGGQQGGTHGLMARVERIEVVAKLDVGDRSARWLRRKEGAAQAGVWHGVGDCVCGEGEDYEGIWFWLYCE